MLVPCKDEHKASVPWSCVCPPDHVLSCCKRDLRRFPWERQMHCEQAGLAHACTWTVSSRTTLICASPTSSRAARSICRHKCADVIINTARGQRQ